MRLAAVVAAARHNAAASCAHPATLPRAHPGSWRPPVRRPYASCCPVGGWVGAGTCPVGAVLAGRPTAQPPGIVQRSPLAQSEAAPAPRPRAHPWRPEAAVAAVAGGQLLPFDFKRSKRDGALLAWRGPGCFLSLPDARWRLARKPGVNKRRAAAVVLRGRAQRPTCCCPATIHRKRGLKRAPLTVLGCWCQCNPA